jgi:hypothetical protein
MAARPKTKTIPSTRRLAQLLLIDRSSPSGLRWKTNVNSRARAGGVAGSRDKIIGRHQYWYLNIDGVRFLAHRIIYSMHYDLDIEGFEIDHLNGDGSDNRIENLRLATIQQNKQNRRTPRNNTSGVKGVLWLASAGKWEARIVLNKKLIRLGSFMSIQDAKEARELAELRLYGKFSVLLRATQPNK